MNRGELGENSSEDQYPSGPFPSLLKTGATSFPLIRRLKVCSYEKLYQKSFINGSTRHSKRQGEDAQNKSKEVNVKKSPELQHPKFPPPICSLAFNSQEDDYMISLREH